MTWSYYEKTTWTSFRAEAINDLNELLTSTAIARKVDLQFRLKNTSLQNIKAKLYLGHRELFYAFEKLESSLLELLP